MLKRSAPELIRGVGLLAAATQPSNYAAALKTMSDFIQAIGEDHADMKDRQDRQAARQNDTSSSCDDLKDSDDETHAWSILRRLEEPARSLNEHLHANNKEPDWEGLLGKTTYTGDNQPWPIGMIDTELANISGAYAAESSVVRFQADKMIEALRTVGIASIIPHCALTKCLSACAKDQRGN